ncbi:acyl-CoA reductase [Candidatus Izemoplasma sp. B36]|uniref:acyl-CoA reductase n=1 Tax=Candidatus Izemoplasma sp. B36 TaxID=3242468 RepID=UPI00355838EA
MLKLGGVVIRMPVNFNKIKFLVGNKKIVESIFNIAPLKPFDQRVIDYLDILSKKILRSSIAKSYPDIITFGFWCRRSSILSYKEKYIDINNRLGRGIAFHIAPSNVPINFAYSLVAGLLSGNINIIRISSKNFDQIEIMKEIINETLSEFLKDYIILIQYDHDKNITDYFSEICDVRIIWGGDNTIRTIRESSVGSRTIEICFADRNSMSIIDAEYFLKTENKKRIINDFYNDTYLSDQNACTSPKIVCWKGENIDNAERIFWSMLYEKVLHDYELQKVKAVEKYSKFIIYASNHRNIDLQKFGNFLYVINIREIDKDIKDHFGDSGIFYQYHIKNSIEEIVSLFDKKLQTISYFGLKAKDIYQNISNLNIKGVDRIVPIGKTLDFDLIWDGYDLINTMSRYIDLK